MAFSKDQKNQLTLLVENPLEFMQKCKDKKIYLAGFKGEYFKDGTGIYHILSECLISAYNLGKYENEANFKKLFDYLLEQEHKISIFDYSGRKDSAFTILKEAVKNSKRSSLDKLVTDILLKEKNIKEEDRYSVRSFITVLANKADIEELKQVMSKFKKTANEHSLLQSLLKCAIETQQNSLLDYLLSSKDIEESLNDKISEYKFNSQQSYNEAKYTNVYSYCVIHNNEYALLKLINKFGDKISFDGKIKEEKSLYRTSIPMLVNYHPLDLALKNNKKIFEKYYQAIDVNARAMWLSGEASYNGKLENIMKSGLGDIVLKDLDNIFTHSEVKDRVKLGIYNQILALGKMESTKYQDIEKILNPLWDKIPSVGAASSFRGSKCLFDNFYSKGNMSEQEIDSFVNIFKKIKERGEFEYSNRLFSNSFFNEPTLVKKLIDNGLGLDTVPTDRALMSETKELSINVFEFYISHSIDARNKNSQPLDVLDINKANQTLKLIYELNHDLIYKKTVTTKYKDKSIFQLAVEHNCREIFELLTVDDFKMFKNTEEQTILESIKYNTSPSQEYRETFNILLEKLLEAGFLTKENAEKYPKAFYSFFDKVTDFELLEKVLKNADIDLNEEIQKDDFWRSLYTENAIPYLQSKITKEIEPENAKKILRLLTMADYQQTHLENLFDITPTVHKIKLSDNDNVLHSAIKNDAYESAMMIAKRFPDLAVEANKQNKMPISYMIVNFAKEIEKNKGKISYTFNRKEFEKLFDVLINCGLQSPNKKANAFFEEQLEKYSIIKETFPEQIKLYECQKLNRALSKNNTPSGKKFKL